MQNAVTQVIQEKPKMSHLMQQIRRKAKREGAKMCIYWLAGESVHVVDERLDRNSIQVEYL